MLVLDITEDADGLHFVDRHGERFTRYEGTWRFVAEGGHT